MKEWICRISGSSFTAGRVYRTDTRGFLIDNDGDKRLRPKSYNFVFPGKFEEVVTLDNK